MIATFKLLINYFIRGFGGPFFVFFFPIILLLIIGEAYLMPKYNNLVLIHGHENIGLVFRSFVGGIVASTTVVISFIHLPGTVIQFKNSVMLKRIGATRLKIWQFFIVLVVFYFILSIISFFYICLIAGLLFATRLTKIDNPWQYVFPDPGNWGEVIAYFLLFITTMSLFGLFIGSIVKKQTTSHMITMFLFFPTSFLIGGMLPIDLINKSEVLKVLKYIFPHTQPILGFTTFWAGRNNSFPIGSNYDELIATSIGVGFALIILFSIAVMKLFKWND